MTDRETQIFEDVIDGLREYHWQLRFPRVVRELRERFSISDTGNAQHDYERARDWVESALNFTRPITSREVLERHYADAGATPETAIEQIADHFDQSGGVHDLWMILEG